ncbi:MAG TPA: hypothetical protein VFO98_12055 [Marmoricola sp.]|nr:hypothetical protein [Marmoricola sp.]
MRGRGASTAGALLAAFVAVLVAALVVGVLSPAPASAWPAAPADRDISPGDQMVTAGRSCSAGFVFARGRHRYVSYPASCALARGSEPVASCRARALPRGTRVTFVDRGRVLGVGRLAWTSVRALARAGVHDHRSCAARDFALVRIVGASRARLSTDPPFWGGPSRRGPLPAPGARLFAYGKDAAHQRPYPSSRYVLHRHGGRVVLSGGPGTVPALRGAGLVDAQGRAVAMVAQVRRDGRPVAIGLAGAAAWARDHGARGLRLLPGSQPFAAFVVL